MAQPTDDFDAAMADLTRQFISELAGHEAEISAAHADLLAGGGAASLARLKARAHRLSGLGRIFGHPVISTRGEALELAIEAGEAAVAVHVEALLNAIIQARTPT